ncbi:hypothetical protein ILUMI_04426 [Ignelater luminosus]|uniref:Uncharacterized protein n=1 Tax=Ignelater luminosus TaxID=2038154 RepID=A0A8K0GL73_IGNLU|nr:hypothetical protein ILUMI_04426 [Ignelater luminosus]
MRSLNKMESQILDTSDRLSELSIVIEDFDSAKNSNNRIEDCTMPEVSLYQRTQRSYSRQSSDASIRRILEEAEHRKHEFWKLIDEHTAVIENLKKIEQLENNASLCKNTPVTAPVSI